MVDRISGVSHVDVVFQAVSPRVHHVPTANATARAATPASTLPAGPRSRSGHRITSDRARVARRRGARVALKNRKYGYAAPIRNPSMPATGMVQATVISAKYSRSRTTFTTRWISPTAISGNRMSTGKNGSSDFSTPTDRLMKKSTVSGGGTAASLNDDVGPHSPPSQNAAVRITATVPVAMIRPSDRSAASSDRSRTSR
jgi:hypothetical protein